MSTETHELQPFGVKVVREEDDTVSIWVATGAGIYSVEQWREIVAFVSDQLNLIAKAADVCL